MASHSRACALLDTWGWLPFLLVSLLVMGIYPRLGETGRGITYVSIGAAALGAVTVALLRRRPDAQGWRWVAAGLGAFVVADLVWAWFDWAMGRPPPFPSVADVLYLGGYPMLIAGYLTLFRFEKSRDGRSRWFDAAIVGVATLVAMAQLVVLPTLSSGRDVSPVTAAVSVAYPVADVLLVVAAVLALSVARRHDLRGWLLGGGALTMLLADVAYASELLGGAYAEATILDVGWLATYVAIGAAALLPPGREPARVPRVDGFQRPLVVVWTMSVLVAVAASAYQVLTGASDVFAVALGACGVTTLFVLISLRVRRMVRRVLAAESRSRAILDALVDAVLTIDSGGVIRAVDGNVALVGDRLIGRPIGDLLSTGVPPSAQDVAVVHVDTVEVVRPDEQTFTADITFSRSPDGEGPWFVVVHDVTDRHQVEEAMRRASQRTAIANTALRQANSRLELANAELSHTAQVKRDFLSLVSHELRTPLTPILGFSALLLHRWGQMSDELRETHLEAIQRHGQRLQRAVDNLLVLGTDRHGSVGPSAARLTDVAALVGAVVGDVDVVVDVDVADGLPQVRVVPDELRLVLRNVLENAIAHGHAPYRIEIGADAEWVEIRVCDSGPGLPPRLLGEMFEPFTQGSVGDRRTVSGLGIGLAVARTLAELNGGSIRYSRQEGSGTCFELRLRRI